MKLAAKMATKIAAAFMSVSWREGTASQGKRESTDVERPVKMFGEVKVSAGGRRTADPSTAPFGLRSG
jgi:hypothetical protein